MKVQGSKKHEVDSAPPGEGFMSFPSSDDRLHAGWDLQTTKDGEEDEELKLDADLEAAKSYLEHHIVRREVALTEGSGGGPDSPGKGCSNATFCPL